MSQILPGTLILRMTSSLLDISRAVIFADFADLFFHGKLFLWQIRGSLLSRIREQGFVHRYL